MLTIFQKFQKYGGLVLTRRPYSYRNAVKFWLTIIIFVAGSDGLIFWRFPHLVQSTAYQMAFEILPIWVWSLLLLATTSLAGAGLLLEGKRIGSFAVTMSFVMHAAICAVFGLSIFALTLDGLWPALSGASKWWMFFVIPVKILSSGAAIEDTD